MLYPIYTLKPDRTELLGGIIAIDAVLAELISAAAADWGVPQPSMPVLPERAVVALRDAFARTRSVRTLRRSLERVLGALVVSGGRDTH